MNLIKNLVRNMLEFNRFINTPIIKDIIENYILSLSMQNILIASNDSMIDISIISEAKIIEHIFVLLKKEYKNHNLNVPDKKLISNYFKSYFKFMNEYLFNMLSYEGQVQLQLINKTIYHSEREIIFHIKELKKSIDRLANLQIENTDNIYKSNIEKYHNILRKNRQKSHVYLLDTLDFSEFYVPPLLKLSYGLADTFDRKYLISGHYFHSRKYINDGLFNDWRHIFDYSSFVYIIGGPGYGKSLFLTKLINDFENANFLNCKDYLIIRGDLKSYQFKNNHPESVLNFLQNSIYRWFT